MTNEVRLFEWLHRALELTNEAEAVLFERDEFRALQPHGSKGLGPAAIVADTHAYEPA